MSDLLWIRLVLAQGFRICPLFYSLTLTPLSWHLCSEVCFHWMLLEYTWDFTGWVWRSADRKKNQKQWYWPITRCFFSQHFKKKLLMYHCPCYTFIQLLFNGQDSLSLSHYFQTLLSYCTCGNYCCVTEEEDSCPGSCGCPVPHWPYTGEEEPLC